MQSTGQTSTQDRSLVLMQGSAIMYVIQHPRCEWTNSSYGSWPPVVNYPPCALWLFSDFVRRNDSVKMSSLHPAEYGEDDYLDASRAAAAHRTQCPRSRRASDGRGGRPPGPLHPSDPPPATRLSPTRPPGGGPWEPRSSLASARG